MTITPEQLQYQLKRRRLEDEVATRKNYLDAAQALYMKAMAELADFLGMELMPGGTCIVEKAKPQ